MVYFVIIYKKGVKKLYKRIRDLREDNDKTQRELAEMLYISKKSYERYENGDREPPFDVIISLAKFYNVSIDYIANLTNSKEKTW